MNNRRLHLILLPALLALAGCAPESDMSELQRFVDQQVNRPPGQIEPLPQFVSYQPFTYSAASLRSPFDAPADVNSLARPAGEEVRPDENRPREFLEQFSIATLNMVGSLGRGGQLWALVRDADGGIHRISVGNYMGRNHGRVVNVTPTQVDLVEIVPSGDGGWIERPQTMVLREPGAPAPAPLAE